MTYPVFITTEASILGLLTDGTTGLETSVCTVSPPLE